MELWALLHELDDPTHLEKPQGFEWVTARRQFDSLVAGLNTAFQTSCATDRSVGDASYHAQVTVPARSNNDRREPRGPSLELRQSRRRGA